MEPRYKNWTIDFKNRAVYVLIFTYSSIVKSIFFFFQILQINITNKKVLAEVES